MGSPQPSAFRGLARMCNIHANSRSAGINPLPSPKKQGVYTRFFTEREKQKQHHPEQYQSIAVHLKAVTERSKRREANLQIGRNLCLLIIRMVGEDIKTEYQQTRNNAKTWKAEATENGAAVIRETLKREEMEGRLDDAMKQVSRVEKERDDLKWVLHFERQKHEAAQNCHQIAISSLRDRQKSEKGKMAEEIRLLRDTLKTRGRKTEEKTKVLNEMLWKQKRELSEVQCFAHESVEHIEKLEQTVALLETGEMMASISQRLSNVLSDISEIAPVRSDNGQSVPEKIRDIRDCMKDLVKELKSRRENAKWWAERVFVLEEERLLWASRERMHKAQLAALNESLLAAGMEIETLRKGYQGDRLHEEISSRGEGSL